MISQIVRELARVIRFLCHDGVTVLLIEQNPKLAAEVADRLATMVKGRIVDSATPCWQGVVHCHHGPLIISVSSVRC
jgi:ABC-type branched-subunit amino acid transport system ATPase component